MRLLRYLTLFESAREDEARRESEPPASTTTTEDVGREGRASPTEEPAESDEPSAGDSCGEAGSA
jgi:hypothetical protein